MKKFFFSCYIGICSMRHFLWNKDDGKLDYLHRAGIHPNY